MRVQESLRTLDDVVKADVKVRVQQSAYETGGQALLHGIATEAYAASMLAGSDTHLLRRPAG